MNSLQLFYKMDAILMNFENSKIFNLQRLLLNLSDNAITQYT